MLISDTESLAPFLSIIYALLGDYQYCISWTSKFLEESVRSLIEKKSCSRSYWLNLVMIKRVPIKTGPNEKYQFRPQYLILNGQNFFKIYFFLSRLTCHFYIYFRWAGQKCLTFFMSFALKWAILCLKIDWCFTFFHIFLICCRECDVVRDKKENVLTDQTRLPSLHSRWRLKTMITCSSC